jgi:hypothetical protein
MTTASGDEIVDDFYQRGMGELAGAPNEASSPAPSSPHRQRALLALPHKSSVTTGDSGKRPKRSREQRLVLALARLLAARMR